MSASSTVKAATSKPISAVVRLAVSAPRRRRPERQARTAFWSEFPKHLRALRKRGKEVAVICGDFNIAHKEIDLKNYKSNKEELQASAARTRVADPRVSTRNRLRRCLPHARPARRAIHVVEQPRQCLRQQRGMAADYQIATPGIALRRRRNLSRREVLRPRAVDH